MFNKFTFSTTIIGLMCIAVLLAVAPILFSSAQAVEFTSANSIAFSQSSSNKAFYRITVKANTPDEITEKNGINLILPKTLAIQWATAGNGNIKLSGNAAEKVDPDPTFSDDLYVLHLNVKANFIDDDEVHIDGLTPMTYKKTLSNRNLGLDINGDNEIDIGNLYSFSVKNVARTDFVAPSIPDDFKAEYDKATKEVKLTWKKPPEWDLQWIAIERRITVGTKQTTVQIYKGLDTTYTDTNIKADDTVRYMIFAADTSNNTATSFGIDLVTKIETPPVVTLPATTPPTTTPAEEEEKVELKRLLNYYDIRYQIKCLATGANPGSDNCLYAKVELLYAQEKLQETKANISLTTDEITLMTSRIKWPELRYKNDCTDAKIPADFCPALKDGINRTKYFINKK